MRTSPGQNLLEAVIAIGVILAAVVGSSSLIVTSITTGRISQTRTEAANFAREGIEIIRAMRDSNWLKFEQNERVGGVLPAWNTGLAAGSYILTYSTTGGWSIVSCTVVGCPTHSVIYNTTNPNNGNRMMYNQYLDLASCNTANSNNCSVGKYSRVITLTLSTDDLGNGAGPDDQPYVLVQSTVNWRARSGPTSLSSQVRLYDWK